jgi:hypothetical protein
MRNRDSTRAGRSSAISTRGLRGRIAALWRARHHPEHESILVWVGGAFNPEDFSPAAVRFDAPEERWLVVFEER